MFFSIIISVYNVERWLAGCLDSVLSQDFTDYEIIIVDDCSPDESYKIYEAYAKQHSCITVLKHSVNKRQGAAKNYGMRMARGEWIVFLDSDDLMAAGALRFYHDKALQTKDGYFACIYDRIDENDCNIKDRYVEEAFSTLYDDGTKVKLSDSTIICAPFLCAKCYRRAFLLENALFFNENILFEDVMFNTKLLLAQSRFVCYNKIVYHYRVNSESCTYGFVDPKHKQKIDNNNVIINQKRLNESLFECNTRHKVLVRTTEYTYFAPILILKMISQIVTQNPKYISKTAICYLKECIIRQNQYDKQRGDCRILVIFNRVPSYLLHICFQFMSKLWNVYKKLFRKNI